MGMGGVEEWKCFSGSPACDVAGANGSVFTEFVAFDVLRASRLLIEVID